MKRLITILHRKRSQVGHALNAHSLVGSCPSTTYQRSKDFVWWEVVGEYIKNLNKEGGENQVKIDVVRLDNEKHKQ